MAKLVWQEQQNLNNNKEMKQTPKDPLKHLIKYLSGCDECRKTNTTPVSDWAETNNIEMLIPSTQAKKCICATFHNLRWIILQTPSGQSWKTFRTELERGPRERRPSLPQIMT